MLEDPWVRVPLLVVVGIVAGAINTLAGGGSLLVLPLLRLLGLEGPAANGTNRIPVLSQALLATVAFARRGYLEWQLSLTLALCTLPGMMGGAWLGTKLEGVWFDRTLAAVMVLVMILLAQGRAGDQAALSAEPSSRRWWTAHALMVAVGFYGGFIMAGVGYLMIAVLHRVLGWDLVRCNQHKVFIITVFTVPALALFAVKGHVHVPLGAAVAVGTGIGGWIGSHLAIKGGELWIRRVLMMALAALVVKLLWP